MERKQTGRKEDFGLLLTYEYPNFFCEFQTTLRLRGIFFEPLENANGAGSVFCGNQLFISRLAVTICYQNPRKLISTEEKIKRRVRGC